MPFDWFLHLEQPDSGLSFLDPDHIRSMGYLARSPEQSLNPHGLPIGFVKDGNSIGLTCAACHTGQINYQGLAWIIDGGPAMGDAETLLRRLLKSLEATLADLAKFDRFAVRLSMEDKQDDLKNELKRVISEFGGYIGRNMPPANAPRFGPGRIDAFGAIFNEVAVRITGDSTNETRVDAPVSYPFLWDTPHHDRVQWNGGAKNFRLPLPVLGTTHFGALGRNVGEVLGVFAELEISAPQGKFYPSSVNFPHMVKLEDMLRTLWSPQWPSEFGIVDKREEEKDSLYNAGAALYVKHCSSCHSVIKRDDERRQIKAEMADAGTDQNMARNVLSRVANSGRLKGRLVFLEGEMRKIRSVEPVSVLLSHVGQQVIAHRLLNSDPVAHYAFGGSAEITLGDARVEGIFSSLKFEGNRLMAAELQDVMFKKPGRQFSVSPQSNWEDFAPPTGEQFLIKPPPGELPGQLLTFNPTAVVKSKYQYKARPLNGIWATAPYLHNGSVPTLDDLLKPVVAKLPNGQPDPDLTRSRPRTFRVGSREFDPKKVGFRTDLGDFEFDVTQPGNSNAGHEYGDFNEQQRLQLIEYLKTL